MAHISQARDIGLAHYIADQAILCSTFHLPVPDNCHDDLPVQIADWLDANQTLDKPDHDRL
jgi:hypothetical protein